MTQTLTDDSLVSATWTSRPGDFVSLMTLYESNYIRLRRLAGDIFAAPDRQISQCTNDNPLHLWVTERSPYTVTLTMTYEFADGDTQIAEPNLQLRVYRDARLAEALHWSRWQSHSLLAEWRNRLARNLDARWQRNMMLNKWLEYCFDRGHRFVAQSSAAR